jgi:hypothetical protein
MPIRSWRELGEELRAARESQHRTLREAGAAVSCSYSTVHRLEKGLAAGRQDIVGALDDLYGAGGRFSDIYGHLMYPLWRSGEVFVGTGDTQAKRSWQHTYPAAHGGDVWVLVMPVAGQGPRTYFIEMNWGPWQRTLVLADLDEQGAVLVTGKSKLTAVPLSAHVTPAAHLLFGTDDEEIDLTKATPVHHGWREVETARDLTPIGTLVVPLRAIARVSDTTPRDRRLLEVAAGALEALDEVVLRRVFERVLDARQPPYVP